MKRVGTMMCVLGVVASMAMAQGVALQTEKVAQYTYSYRVVDGKAEIFNNGECAITPSPIRRVQWFTPR